MQGWRVYVISLFAIILWGLSYIWSDQLLSNNIPVEYFVFIRCLIAAFILFMINLVSGADLRIKKKDLYKFLLLAMCEPFIYFVCETYGIALTESPTYSALVIATTPIFSVVAGVVLFNERFTLWNLLGLLIGLAGLVMVTLCASETGDKFILGVVLLFVAVIAEVGHASFTKSLSIGYRSLVITMYQFAIGSLYLLPLFITKGCHDFTPFYLSWEVMGPIVALAALCSSLAFSLWVSTIKFLGVAKSSIFMAMIPIVTAIAGALFGTESLTMLQWAGIFVAVFGVVLSQLSCCKNNGTLKH